MRNDKKTWSRPQLIIITRNRSEEYVLLSCKGTGIVGPAWAAVHACSHHIHGDCSTIGAS